MEQTDSKNLKCSKAFKVPPEVWVPVVSQLLLVGELLPLNEDQILCQLSSTHLNRQRILKQEKCFIFCHLHTVAVAEAHIKDSFEQWGQCRVFESICRILNMWNMSLYHRNVGECHTEWHAGYKDYYRNYSFLTFTFTEWWITPRCTCSKPCALCLAPLHSPWGWLWSPCPLHSAPAASW